MQKSFQAAVALALGMAIGHTATTKKKTAAKSSTTTKTAGKPSAAKKGKKSAGRASTPSRTRQLAPTPDRYKEIQQALAAKGYLTPEQANGQWTDASAEALKRFQTDQNLDATGKINSLSLIALGLGPKHEPATQTSVP